MKSTAEDGPATETITVAVGRCFEDGHYSTVFPEDIVRNKQYCISDIRSVLEDKVDFSLACPRTRAYWRSWFRSVWGLVVRNIQRCIGCTLSINEISIALHAFMEGCGDGWLRYVLDIFYTESNNLCMFFYITSDTIGSGSENLHKLHVYGGAVAPHKRRRPP